MPGRVDPTTDLRVLHIGTTCLLLALLVPLTACAPGDDPATGAPVTSPPAISAPPTSASTTPTTPTTTTPTTTTPATTPTTTPASSPTVGVLDRRIDFLVAALDDPATATDSAITEHFAPSFLAVVPADGIRAALADPAVAAGRPWKVTARDGDDTGAVVTLTGADGSTFTLTIQIEPAGAGQIVAAQLLPGSVADLEQAFVDPATRADVDAALDAVASRVVYGVYDVTDGTCTATLERDAATVVPTGSTFKLWVLAAVAQTIERGELAWDDPVAVDPAHRSSPEGEVYPLADGAELTVRRLAELMISISDNTATDHLIALVGREAVEATMRDLGVSTSARNIPFLTTRELFLLKFIDPSLGDRYLALDSVEARREFLDGEVAATQLPWIADPAWTGGDSISTPTRIDELEWFATPVDVCTTFVALDRQATTPGLEPVGEILAMNPGLPFPEGQWSTIRFKGGSEPGVVMFGYWLEAPTGERRAVTVSLTDEQGPIGEIESAVAVARLLGLVARDATVSPGFRARAGGIDRETVVPHWAHEARRDRHRLSSTAHCQVQRTPMTARRVTDREGMDAHGTHIPDEHTTQGTARPGLAVGPGVTRERLLNLYRRRGRQRLPSAGAMRSS